MSAGRYGICNVCGGKCRRPRRRCRKCRGWKRCIACNDFFEKMSNCMCPFCRKLVCDAHPVSGRHAGEAGPERIAQLAGRASLRLALFGGG